VRAPRLDPKKQEARGVYPWIIVGLVGMPVDRRGAPDENGDFLPALEALGIVDTKERRERAQQVDELEASMREALGLSVKP
jgi:hypothetical protein